MPESNPTPPTSSSPSVDLELIAEAKKQAAMLVSEAERIAKTVIERASKTAEKLLDDSEDRTTKALAEALRQVFGENQDSRRFIDITRIPLICQNIEGIHLNLKELKDMVIALESKYVTHEEFFPYKSVLNLIGGLVVVAVAGGLLALVILERHPNMT